MLAVLLQSTQMILLSGTQMMKNSTNHNIDHCIENEQGKITNEHYTVILGATLKKERIE